DAYHQAGRLSESETLFLEAERLQEDDRQELSLIAAMRCFYHCELLLAQRDHQGVIKRATEALERVKGNKSPLDIAACHLSLGRAHLHRARAEGTNAREVSQEHLDQAVDALRESRAQSFIPYGLLARAELYLFTGDHAEARAALNEAMDIATRDPQGHMKLFVTDCHLGYARLALAEKKPEVARDELTKARGLIKETGYHRRDAELTELENAAEGPRDPDA
ncbi:MAG: hypothetical protein IID35_10505, partial [Planctomycetes bacterium]|nr:hypothetical protein [Planctomycetota bacterium]